MRGIWALILLFILGAISGNAHAQVDLNQHDSVLARIFTDSVNIAKHRYDDNNGLRSLATSALDYAVKANMPAEQASNLVVLGAAEMRESNFGAGVPWFRKAEKILLEDLKDTLAAASVLVNIANCKIKQDSLEVGTEIIMDAIKIFEVYNDSSYLAYSYNTLAAILGQVGNQPEQLKYSQKAFQLNGANFEGRYSLRLASNLAMNLQKIGMLDSAAQIGQKTLEAGIAAGDKRTQIHMHILLCRVDFQEERFEEAADHARQALTWEQDLNEAQFYTDAYSFLGESLLALGRNKEALEALEKALVYGKQDGSAKTELAVMSRIHEAQFALGMFEEAYQSLTLFKAIKDSLLKVENVSIVNEVQTKYETEKKEQEIENMKQEAKFQDLKLRQRTTLGAVLILIVLLIAGGIYFVSQQRVAKKEQAVTHSRLMSLRMQLNPHFIFNALTAIQNYILSGKDVKQATRYLSNFARVMRAFLEYNQEELIPLEKEMGALELYIGMQKMRFEDGFEHRFEVDPEIDPSEVVVPPMLIQPFVENAVEHGLRNMLNGELTLSYKLEGERLKMTVMDNGRGRSNSDAQKQEKLYEKRSLATKITEERIALLNSQGQFKSGFQFQIDDLNADGSGTIVTFNIPLIYQS